MLPFPKSVNKRTLLLSGMLLMAVVAIYFIGTWVVSRNAVPSIPYIETTSQDGKIKIQEDCTLVQKIIYDKCGDEEEFSSKATSSLVGLTLTQVKNIYSGWAIEKFDSHEVIMTLTIDSFCRDHVNNMFLGVHDGKITIFYGHPGPKAIVKEVTDIPVSRLQEKDAEDVRRGLVVGSREELLRALEGLQTE
ncbi:MAG: hypothetical protein H6Q67_961 [Firmicutes bacterium]|nr:hypothetical protein [Bacillota bacterium]